MDHFCVLVILKKLPSEIRLIVSRNCTNVLWDLTRMLKLINEKVKARELLLLSDHLEVGESIDHFTESTSFTYSSLAWGLIMFYLSNQWAS